MSKNTAFPLAACALLILVAFQVEVEALKWKSALMGHHQRNQNIVANQSEKKNAKALCAESGAGDILLGVAPEGYRCPSTNPGDNTQPDPANCERYYTCYAGSDVCLYQCRVQQGQQLVFDLAYYGCNFPSPSICGSRPTPGPTTAGTGTTNTPAASTTTTRPSGFVCPGNGNWPINSNVCASNYYNCDGGVASLESCPGTSLFDPVLRRCVAADQCKVGGDYDCVLPNGFFPVPGQECTKNYYTCINDFPYPTECPENSVFDPIQETCVRPGTGNCA